MSRPQSKPQLDAIDVSNLEGFSIQDLLPYKLYHINAIHERIVYANMTRTTNGTLPEWRVMGNIASGIVTFTQLADELLLDKGQLSNVIKQLERKQLVEKQKSALDGRKMILSLTDLGKEKKTFIIDMATRYRDVIEQGLDLHESAALYSALDKVEKNIRNFWSNNHD